MKEKRNNMLHFACDSVQKGFYYEIISFWIEEITKPLRRDFEGFFKFSIFSLKKKSWSTCCQKHPFKSNRIANSFTTIFIWIDRWTGRRWVLKKMSEGRKDLLLLVCVPSRWMWQLARKSQKPIIKKSSQVAPHTPQSQQRPKKTGDKQEIKEEEGEVKEFVCWNKRGGDGICEISPWPRGHTSHHFLE